MTHQLNQPAPAPAPQVDIAELYAQGLAAWDADSDKYLQEQFEASLQCQPIGERTVQTPWSKPAEQPKQAEQ